MPFHHLSNVALFLAQLALRSRAGVFEMSDKALDNNQVKAL